MYAFPFHFLVCLLLCFSYFCYQGIFVAMSFFIMTQFPTRHATLNQHLNNVDSMSWLWMDVYSMFVLHCDSVCWVGTISFNVMLPLLISYHSLTVCFEFCLTYRNFKKYFDQFERDNVLVAFNNLLAVVWAVWSGFASMMHTGKKKTRSLICLNILFNIYPTRKKRINCICFLYRFRSNNSVILFIQFCSPIIY